MAHAANADVTRHQGICHMPLMRTSLATRAHVTWRGCTVHRGCRKPDARTTASHTPPSRLSTWCRALRLSRQTRSTPARATSSLSLTATADFPVKRGVRLPPHGAPYALDLLHSAAMAVTGGDRFRAVPRGILRGSAIKQVKRLGPPAWVRDAACAFQWMPSGPPGCHDHSASLLCSPGII